MTKRKKVLAWIETELVDKKRKLRPPKGLPRIHMDGWRYVVFGKDGGARVRNLSKSEKKFALEAVRACGFMPRWTS